MAERNSSTDDRHNSKQRTPVGQQHAAARNAATDDDHPLIDVRGLHVRFGKQTVLRDITLEIPRGQTVCIIGESGCGKTVMMKTLIGLVTPTEGQTLFDGQDLTKLGDRELAKQRTRFGFVFQQAALFDSMSVADNVAFPLRQHTNKTAREMHDIVIRLLADVGLPESAARKRPAELSGGMRKRVGLARALALEPEAVLYDEPTTGLDPIMSDVINELILHTRDLHPVTSIVVTHDMHTTRKVPDRVVMFYPVMRLKEGEPQILFDGPPSEMEDCGDSRVTQFVRGEAGERLMEMAEKRSQMAGAGK